MIGEKVGAAFPVIVGEPVHKGAIAGIEDIVNAAFGETGLLLIEHNIGFITRLCARIYVLDSGRLIAEGAPQDVVAAPAVISAYLGVDDDA